MTLPSSFPLSVSQINVELGRNAGDPFDIQGTAERGLAGVPSGPISFSDFLGKSSKSVTFLQYDAVGSGTSPSLSINFGAAAASRTMLIAVHWAEGGTHRTLNSATIAGNAATIIVQRGHTGGTTGLGAALISAAIPTGTSGTVTANFSGSVTDSGFAAYSLLGLSLLGSGSDQTAGTTGPLSVTVSTSGFGAVIGAYTGSTNTIGTGVSWTNVTEQYDLANTTRHSGAFITGAAAGTLAVGATQGVIGNSGNDLVVTSWS